MKRIFNTLIAIILLSSCANETPLKDYESKEFGVYMRGNLAGKYTSEINSAGNYYYTFNFSDRGRGPELTQTITLDNEGYMASTEITGVNYLKDTISEIFKVENQKAHWKSNSEEGEADATAMAFYSSINGTLGESELLIQKLLSSPNQQISLFPSGSVEVSDLETHTINGISLRLVEIVGFGFTPSYLWIDKNDRVFASVHSWLTIIEEDNYTMAEEMLSIQTEKENTYFKNVAESRTTTPEGNILIKNINLFNAITSEIEPNKTVIVEGNKIASISEDIPDNLNDFTVIEGEGKTLLPGLFDNHVHISRSDGLMHLAAGVTSVRDMANSRELLDMRKEFDNNTVMGPRVVTLAGFIDQKGPYAGPGLTISNVEEGIKAIEDFAKDGYHQIKLYSSIDPSWVKPLANKAHELGLRLSGHIPAYMLAEQAIKDGYDEIQHVNMVVLNFLSDTIDSRTPKRFSEVAAHAHKLDLKGAEFQSFVNLLKEKDIEIDPTVSIFEDMFTTKAGEVDKQFEAVVDRLPIQVQRSFYSGGLPIPIGKEDNYKASFDKLLEIVKELHDQGVTIIPGTDAMAGFAFHKELENYVRAGIPANEVLKMATITSAELTNTHEILGSIESGKLADLIIIDGNPVENISDIRRVEITIKDGRIYNSKNLYEAIGVKHFK